MEWKSVGAEEAGVSEWVNKVLDFNTADNLLSKMLNTN